MRLQIKELINFHFQKSREAAERAENTHVIEERIKENSASLMYLKTIHFLEKLNALEAER